MSDTPIVAEDAEAALHHVVVATTEHDERIDALLAARIAGASRGLVQRWIEDGAVTVGGVAVTKAGRRMKLGEEILVIVPEPEPIEVVPEDLPIRVLFDDAEIIVVDKAAGMVVHPAAGHPRGTLVNALLFHCRDLSGIGGALRPGIVHRLDKDTSGVMVVTKNDHAHAHIGAQFAAKSRGEPGGIVREYVGIAAPPPPRPSGTLRTLHARHPSDRKRFTTKGDHGKVAVTHYEIIQSLVGAALVKFKLETGRTHQIRVHAADAGWPLIGDQLYGKPPKALVDVAATLGRQALHARLLELEHPVTGERMRFESPLPADFAATLAALSPAGRP